MSNAATPAPKKDVPEYRFRVRSGTYWNPEPVVDPETKQPVRDASDKVVLKDVIYGPGRPAGDIVKTPKRLDKLMNRPESRLFELLDQNDDPRVGQLQEVEQRAAAAETRFRRTLDLMNQRELLDFAEQEAIDLKGETAKEKVRKLILAGCGYTAT